VINLGLQVVLSRAMVLRMMRSLRMQAVRMTLAALPAFASRSAKALMTGLHLRAGQGQPCTGSCEDWARPPEMHRRPRNVPLSRFDWCNPHERGNLFGDRAGPTRVTQPRECDWLPDRTPGTVANCCTRRTPIVVVVDQLCDLAVNVIDLGTQFRRACG